MGKKCGCWNGERKFKQSEGKKEKIGIKTGLNALTLCWAVNFKKF